MTKITKYVKREKVTCRECGKKLYKDKAVPITSRTLPEYNGTFAHKKCWKKI